MDQYGDDDLFQFCSIDDPDVQVIMPTVEVSRLWLRQLKDCAVGPSLQGGGGGRGLKRRRRNEQHHHPRHLEAHHQDEDEDEDEEAEDYFLFHAKPAKATKSSLVQLGDNVLTKVFLLPASEESPLTSRNASYAEHLAYRHQKLTHAFSKWMLQLQYYSSASFLYNIYILT